MAIQIDDIKDRVKTELTQIWERIQESSIYHQLSDRYENLSPVAQKATLVGAICLVALFFLSFPIGSFFDSSSSVEDFATKRKIIRDLFRVSRDAQNIPQIPSPPSLDMLSNQIQADLKDMQLLPTQIKGVQTGSAATSLIKSSLVAGTIRVSLEQLNLRQIVDVGYRLQSKLISIKLKDIEMIANAKDSRYFDVIYTILVMNVPDFSVSTPAEEEKPKKNKIKKKGGDE